MELVELESVIICILRGRSLVVLACQLLMVETACCRVRELSCLISIYNIQLQHWWEIRLDRHLLL